MEAIILIFLLIALVAAVVIFKIIKSLVKTAITVAIIVVIGLLVLNMFGYTDMDEVKDQINESINNIDNISFPDLNPEVENMTNTTETTNNSEAS